MSYQFDTTRLSPVTAVKAADKRPVRILARRTARQMRREIRSL